MGCICGTGNARPYAQIQRNIKFDGDHAGSPYDNTKIDDKFLIVTAINGESRALALHFFAYFQIKQKQKDGFYTVLLNALIFNSKISRRFR